MTLHQHVHSHDQGLARLLQLDAILHERYLFDVTTWLRRLAVGTRVRRVLDVGAGTGSGTFALAQRFTDADIVAIDLSEDMLERVRSVALFSGLAGRIATRQTDIADDVASLGAFDLAWASACLHEVDDAGRAFSNLFTVLRPGGILAITEMAAPPRLLPDELAAFEERLHSAAETSRTAFDNPDWSGALSRAGFAVMQARTFALDERQDGAGPAGEYAHLYLQRIAHSALPQLDPADSATLSALLGGGPDGVRQRDDLRIRGIRTAWVARRPA